MKFIRWKIFCVVQPYWGTLSSILTNWICSIFYNSTSGIPLRLKTNNTRNSTTVHSRARTMKTSVNKRNQQKKHKLEWENAWKGGEGGGANESEGGDESISSAEWVENSVLPATRVVDLVPPPQKWGQRCNVHGRTWRIGSGGGMMVVVVVVRFCVCSVLLTLPNSLLLL